MAGWCLEGVTIKNADALVRISRFPFVVGRDAGCDLPIASAETSRQHAVIDLDIGGSLRLTDLNSGNGTFVNRAQIYGSVLLADGDVVHFGTTEFRLRHVEQNVFDALGMSASDQTVLVGREPLLSEHFVMVERQFLDMLKARAVHTALQPIVHARDGRLRAFEVLGRGQIPELPQTPIDMFVMAGRLGKEVELSEAFRWAGLTAAATFAPNATLFVNVHPREMFTEPLYRSIELLRAMVPTAQIVIEIHETAVTQIADVKAMALRLQEINVQFAYDDFGAGQARLVELVDAPPHYVKFDMGLIRDIDRASPKKQQLVSQLVRIVHDVGAIALAEGVETPAEAHICAVMNFDLIQGYLAGKPMQPERGWPYPPGYVAPAIGEVTTTITLPH